MQLSRDVAAVVMKWVSQRMLKSDSCLIEPDSLVPYLLAKSTYITHRYLRYMRNLLPHDCYYSLSDWISICTLIFIITTADP